MNRYAPKEKGYSLIEIVIALTVLVMVAMAINGVWTTGVMVKERAWQRTEATAIAQGILEEIATREYSEITSVGEQPVTGNINYHAKVNVNSVASQETALLKVTVEVWPVKEPERKVRLITYLAER